MGSPANQFEDFRKFECVSLFDFFFIGMFCGFGIVCVYIVLFGLLLLVFVGFLFSLVIAQMQSFQLYSCALGVAP